MDSYASSAFSNLAARLTFFPSRNDLNLDQIYLIFSTPNSYKHSKQKPMVCSTKWK